MKDPICATKEPMLAGGTSGYLDGLGIESGWLVIFDRRPSAPPLAERRAASAATTPGGRQVALILA